MIEQALLDRIESLVKGLGLAPAPKLIGVVEPVALDELPAVVLATEESTRPGNGLGERSLTITDGVLPWKAEIDLANPVLAGDPPFTLVSTDRRRLVLPHGGLVRQDASSGPLNGGDIRVHVDGASRTLVQGTPAPGEFSADPVAGALVFGDPLPDSGKLTADYFLGQWEQRTARSQGTLRVTVVAADAAAVQTLSRAVLSALAPRQATPATAGLQLSVAEIGSVGAAAPPIPTARTRTVRFRFEFEQTIDVPESAGGIIQRIPVNAVVQ